MKLAISNIAWESEQDAFMYSQMKKYGYTGLEIAPTRWTQRVPYNFPEKARQISNELWEKYGFVVVSMQSIWYGRAESLFGSEKERIILLHYTMKAIDFAEKIGCRNLVFGCPRNRCIPEGASDDIAVAFFKTLGDYAYSHHTVLSMEANPPLYNTNYINTTYEAIELVKKVKSPGFLLNLDFGTMIQNAEALEELADNGGFIHHVHISEPGLCPIQKRNAHLKLAQMLCHMNYSGFVSIEMGKTDNMAQMIDAMIYIREIFA